jgi:LacI family transcriptional regulator
VAGVFVVDASVHFSAEYLAQRFGDKNRPGLIGYDLVPENRKMLAQGKIDFILTQRPVEQGYRAVMRLFRSVVLSEPIPIREFTPIDIVTQENDEYFVDWENR